MAPARVHSTKDSWKAAGLYTKKMENRKRKMGWPELEGVFNTEFAEDTEKKTKTVRTDIG
jgi:hypothetical protein